MVTAVSVATTGFEELDARLTWYTEKEQKRYVRAAIKKSLAIVKDEYQQRVAVETGAMRDALVVKVAARQKKRHVIGQSLVLDRDLLFSLRESRGGRIGLHAARGNEKFFYPAVIELGDSDTPAQRPMRGSLYDNESQVRSEFAKQLRLSLDRVARRRRKKAR